MAGFIILDDGRAYAGANWAFRKLVEAVAEAVPSTPDGKELAEWLQSDPSVQVYYSVDLRELTPINRDILTKAIEDAYRLHMARGPIDWDEPECWDEWIDRFSDLVKMIECVKLRQPSRDFNPHMDDLIPPTGDKSGPGW